MAEYGAGAYGAGIYGAAYGIAVALIGATDPQAVQVTVTGLAVGEPYVIQGESAVGSWVVRGGDGFIATDQQAVITDIAAPVNVPVTYHLLHDAIDLASSPITIPYSGQYLLSSVDGSLTVKPTTLRDNGGPREVLLRSATYDIPGRLLPVFRYDVAAGESGEIVVDTDGDETDNLFTLMRAGGLMLLRTNGAVRDLPAVQWLLVQSCPSQLNGIDNVRTWTLSYRVVDDPQPDADVTVETWDQFDSVYAGSTWNAFDVEWAGSTWNDFDKVDWANR